MIKISFTDGAAEEREELFDAVVCVMDAQRLGAEGDAAVILHEKPLICY